MKDRVNTTESVRKAKGIRVGSCFRKDFEGPQKLFGKLLGRPCSAEKFRFNKCLLTNNKIWRRHPARIRRTLITALSFGNYGLEFLMKLVKINDKFFSTRRC